MAKAARVRAGDLVWLFDGRGQRAQARVESVGEDRTELSVLSFEEGRPFGLRLVLGVGLLEGKVMDFVVEKAAELGCAGIVPLITLRSLRLPAERTAAKVERWARIVREAVKQSKGRELMTVEPPRSFKAFLKEPPDGARFFFSEHGGRPMKDVLSGARDPRSRGQARVVLVVGPKGGWAAAEEGSLREAGFEALSLGEKVLKAETAAVVAAGAFLHFWAG